MINYNDAELEKKIAGKLCVVCDNTTDYTPMYCIGNCETCSVESCFIKDKPVNVPLCKDCENILAGWLQLEKYDKIDEFLLKIPEVSHLVYPDDKYAIMIEISKIDKQVLRSTLESTLGVDIWQYMN